MDLVLAQPEGTVTSLTLNRPQVRNALNVALLTELSAALEAAENNRSARLLVLRGAGPVFCSGMDLTDATDPERVARSAELLQTVLYRLASSRLITIAAVQGAAVAGGAGLMSACDFALATADAKFGYPEVRRGLVPALIMTFLRRQLRERDARELLLLGKMITAERAFAIGLINRVAADGAALDLEVQSIVAAILQGGPDTVAETKALLRDLWPTPLSQDFDRAHEVHLRARRAPEAIEGVAAFNAKRAPKWAP